MALEPAVNLTDLHPRILYSVVIVAFNDIGNSSESEIITFGILEEGRGGEIGGGRGGFSPPTLETRGAEPPHFITSPYYKSTAT